MRDDFIIKILKENGWDYRKTVYDNGRVYTHSYLTKKVGELDVDAFTSDCNRVNIVCGDFTAISVCTRDKNLKDRRRKAILIEISAAIRKFRRLTEKNPEFALSSFRGK